MVEVTFSTLNCHDLYNIIIGAMTRLVSQLTSVTMSLTSVTPLYLEKRDLQDHIHALKWFQVLLFNINNSI